MLLLPRCNLSKFLLRDPPDKSFQTTKDLMHTLRVQKISLRSPNKRLDLDQTLLIQMRAQSLIYLVQHQTQEFLMLIRLGIEDFVHVAHMDQFLARNLLAHYQSLIRLTDTQSSDECSAGSALGYQAQGRERREKESMRSGVDEIGKGGYGCRETNRGPIERCDEYLWVCVEGVGYV